VSGSARLLYVGTLPPHQGGSALVAAQVLPGLARRGYRVEAIAPITDGARDPFADEHPDLPLRRFTLPYLDTSPDTPPSDDYRRLERERIEQLVTAAVADQTPDAIVIGRESFAPHVLGLANGIPTVLLIQGATTMGILGGTYPPELADQLIGLMRQVDVPVSSARHMRDTLAGLGVPGVHVVPNPVDLDRFQPAPAAGGRLVVAHVSNLKRLKRAHDLVAAAEIVLREEPEALFAVVGEGPCREELEADCAERGLAEAFRFTGWVHHAEVPRHINAADVVAMPSAGEAQALAYLETQACGRTLVASDIPAAAEVVEHGRTGLLHPTGDVPALAEAILRAARDPDLRARIGREARRSAERHSLDVVVTAYDELLRGRLNLEPRCPTASTSPTRTKPTS
jgi:glycosyltransferase involved in cell wall biosynthesis